MKKLLLIICALISLSAMAQKVHDSAAFEIKNGDVVKITLYPLSNTPHTYSFDANGALVGATIGNESFEIAEISRNDDGYITAVRYNSPTSSSYIEYSWENGQLTGEGSEYECSSYSYDNEGNVVTVSALDGDMNFTDYVFDSKGNWISRKCTYDEYNDTQLRDIEYADGTISSAVEGRAGKKSGKSTPISEIIFAIVILVAMLWVAGHILFITLVKEKVLGPITVDEMKALRAAAGRPAESAGDDAKVREILAHIYTDDTTTDPKDPNIQLPTTYDQIKDYRKSMQEIRDLMPTDPEMVEAYNEAAEVLNGCQKRVFDGSKTFLGVCIALTIGLCIISGQWGLLIMLVPAVIYWLATRKPMFRCFAADFKGKKIGGGFIATILGGAAAGIASARTIREVTYLNGQEVDRRDDHSEHWGAWIAAVIFFVVVCVLLPLIVIVNYLRNYVLYK